ncbi:MAG: phage tail protein [Cyanobacteriota bacterium]|nr:phage tail protein [Cyanobacteriota bacterium]
MIATEQAQGFLLGEVVLYAGTTVPAGFLPLDGRSVPIPGNESLFRVVGTQYGGDGVSNFFLPNLIGVAPVGRTANIGAPIPTGPVQGTLLVQLPDGTTVPANQVNGQVQTVGGDFDLTNVTDDTVTFQQLRAALAAAANEGAGEAGDDSPLELSFAGE